MKTILLTNSNKESCLIADNDVILVTVNGKNAFILGGDLIQTLVNSNEWNAKRLDARTGEETSVNKVLEIDKP